MSTTTVKLHRSTSGNWVPCTASVRGCPREHVTVSGEASEASKFFADISAQEEMNSQRPDASKHDQPSFGPKVDLNRLAEAQASFPDRSADGFKRYTLPKGAMGFGSQDERYAQVVTTIAIQVVIDKARLRGVVSQASAKNVKDELERALKTFNAKESQEALQLSLARTQTILDKHTQTYVLELGVTQERIDVVPAIRDLERKALTTDIDDPDGSKTRDLGAPAANSFVPSADTFAKEAATSFEERARNLNTYEIPAGLHADSSSAATYNEVLAQDVTRSAIANLLNARSLVDEDYAPYSEVRRRLDANFSGLANDVATQTSIARTKAILKRESSLLELHGGTGNAYVDVKAALRALEDKGLTDDLNSPLPNERADHARSEREAQQREATRAVRAARRAPAEQSKASAPASDADEMRRLFTEDPTEFYRRNRANAAAKAEAEGKRRPPRFIARGEKQGPDVNGPRF